MSIPPRFRSMARFTLRALGLASIATLAVAHPGHEVSTNMFASGLAHPLTGFDHLFAMLAVGLWSALTHSSIRQAIWTPLSFLCLLLVGALLGMSGVSVPAVEPMIMASLFVLGLLVATRYAAPNWFGPVLVGFFALFHGLAHGSELPLGDGGGVFIAGFMLTTFALHIVGLAAGFSLKHRNAWRSRITGAGIAAYGVTLFMGVA